MNRASWDETWSNVAEALGRRSACVNRRVGAFIVDKNNRPVSGGYNGSPANYKDSNDAVSCASYCPRAGSSNRMVTYENCVAVHAEANALLFADRSSYAGGTIYVTNPCCWECTRLIANSGLSRVVFYYSAEDSHDDWQSRIGFLNSCGIVVDMKEKNVDL